MIGPAGKGVLMTSESGSDRNRNLNMVAPMWRTAGVASSAITPFTRAQRGNVNLSQQRKKLKK